MNNLLKLVFIPSLLILVVFNQSALAQLSNPIKTDSGYIAGTVIGAAEKPVSIFRGIPYAAPPIDNLRWRPPQPVEPWEGIREATSMSPWAAQRYPSPAVFEVATDKDMSEDSLYLNVLTPATKPNEKLPVMVWLHGGRLDILSGNMARYNSPELAAQGTVLVNINHRLNAFGYLAHPWLSEESSHNASGDYGMLDIIAALEWVQKNIAQFGGDPANVTIFGQSGGGRKVNWLMTSPLVPKGLFHRAISMSSSIDSVTLYTAEADGKRLIEKLGVKSLTELRAVPWREIVQAAEDIGFRGRVVETGYSLPEPITTRFSKGLQQDVPFMIGMVLTEDAGHFNVPVNLLPIIQQGKSPVYAYTFRAVPNGWKQDGVSGWHAIDMAYLFGDAYNNFTHAKPEYFRAYAARQGAQDKDPKMTEADRKFASDFQKMWVQFAKTGNPNIEGLSNWPTYNAQGDQYIELDNGFTVKQGYSKLVHNGEG